MCDVNMWSRKQKSVKLKNKLTKAGNFFIRLYQYLLCYPCVSCFIHVHISDSWCCESCHRIGDMANFGQCGVQQGPTGSQGVQPANRHLCLRFCLSLGCQDGQLGRLEADLSNCEECECDQLWPFQCSPSTRADRELPYSKNKSVTQPNLWKSVKPHHTKLQQWLLEFNWWLYIYIYI